MKSVFIIIVVDIPWGYIFYVASIVRFGVVHQAEVTWSVWIMCREACDQKSGLVLII